MTKKTYYQIIKETYYQIIKEIDILKSIPKKQKEVDQPERDTRTVDQRLTELKQFLANEPDQWSLYAQDLRLSISICERRLNG
jgi:DNA-binding transcriptional regulator GbsR (MarR family)